MIWSSSIFNVIKFQRAVLPNFNQLADHQNSLENAGKFCFYPVYFHIMETIVPVPVFSAN